MTDELEDNPKKKAMKAYPKFVKAHFKEVARKHPKLKPPQIMKLLAKMYWGKKKNPKRGKRGKKKLPTFDSKKYTKTMHKHGKVGHAHRHKGRTHNHKLNFWGYVNKPARLKGKKLFRCKSCKKFFVKK